MKNWLKISLLSVASFVLVVIVVGIGYVATMPQAPVVEASLVAVDKPLLTLINNLRTEKGAAPLTASPELNKSAQLKADDMVTQHYFGHVSPQGKHGYEYIRELLPNRTLGSENLAYCGKNDNNTGAFELWLNSPAHYRGMIDPRVTLYGEGKAYDTEKGCTIYVNHFAAV